MVLRDSLGDNVDCSDRKSCAFRHVAFSFEPSQALARTFGRR
jgi:hypothetical protein